MPTGAAPYALPVPSAPMMHSQGATPAIRRVIRHAEEIRWDPITIFILDNELQPGHLPTKLSSNGT